MDKFSNTDWTRRQMGCGEGEQRGIEDSAEVSGSPDWVDDGAPYTTGEMERLGAPWPGQLHVTREAPQDQETSTSLVPGLCFWLFHHRSPAFQSP